MRTSIIFSLILFILGCTNNQQNELMGVWDATNYLDYPSDTIRLDGDFDTGFETTTIKTDSGIMEITHVEDSILSVMPTSKTTVLQLHFDDESHGVLSIYDIDSNRSTTNNEHRQYAYNYNFWTFSSDGRTYLVTDYHFSQFGRALDTAEYKLISTHELVIEDDTLKRLYEP